MEYNTRISHRLRMVLLFVAVFSVKQGWSQCNLLRIEHTSGTQQVGCTTVTVTSDGQVYAGDWPPCYYGPYLIGGAFDGSYTFTFSPPIPHVSVNVQALNNNGNNIEELFFEVNGSFYPITNPGQVDGCWDPAIIWPPGTLRGPIGGFGSASDVSITQNISSLKIGNNWVSGVPYGIGVSLYFCCTLCETFAGVLTSDPLNLCIGEVATLPAASQTVLDGNDVLQYILFSNPNDTLGSILATSSTPEFAFVPASMSVGTPYYIAAMAGNNLNGNVDPSDTCLHISNAILVAWWPPPSVNFSIADDNLCAGNCYDVDLSFFGTPPFSLSGEVKAGNVVISTFSATYTNSTGLLNICLPANTPTGSVNVQATMLTDGHCTCD